MSDEVKFINVEEIRTNKEALREVQFKDEAYLELCNSVKQSGILTPIQVSPDVDPQTKESFYILVDGTQRLSAAKAAGLTTVPALIKSGTELEILERQLISNAIRVETKPVQYSKHLRRIMNLNPLVSSAQMAARLGKSDAWLKGRLGLTDLNPDVAKLVDEGVINVSSATALSTLPPEVQVDYLQAAQTMTHDEFTPIIAARKKELDKAKREGRAAESKDFQAQPYLQKIGPLKEEQVGLAIGNMLIGKLGLRTAIEGWKAALDWVLHLDPISVAEQKKEYDKINADREERNKAATVEREKKKLQSNEVKAKRSKLMLETLEAGGNVEEAMKKFDKENGLES